MEQASLNRCLLGIKQTMESNGCFRYKALSLEMKLSKSRISVLVDELEEQGYAIREKPREVRVTPKGIAAIEELSSSRTRLIEGILRKLPLGREDAEHLADYALSEESSALRDALAV